MKIKLTLYEKYREMVEDIRSVVSPPCDYFINNYTRALDDLRRSWFNTDDVYSALVKVVERIHSADDFEWIKPKYNWRLKSDKFDGRWLWLCDDKIMLLNDAIFSVAKDRDYTESEFKKLLEGTGLPFEAFEKVIADE